MPRFGKTDAFWRLYQSRHGELTAETRETSHNAVNVAFKEGFTKDLRAVRDKSLLRRVRAVIEEFERAQRPNEIPGLKKLKGGSELAVSELKYISPQGHKIEGTGVTPNRAVPLTLADLQHHRDAALEAAENALQKTSANVRLNTAIAPGTMRTNEL